MLIGGEKGERNREKEERDNRYLEGERRERYNYFVLADNVSQIQLVCLKSYY